MLKKNNIFVSKAVTISECGPAECGSLPCCTGQSSLAENILTHPFHLSLLLFCLLKEDFYESIQVLLNICPNIMCHKRETRNHSRKNKYFHLLELLFHP